MPSVAIPCLKFVGTISLGLLTGISYTTATLAIPSLLLLPSATSAHQTYTSLLASTALHLRVLSVLAVTCYTSAYLLAPARAGRHPYLLWTSLAVAVGAGVDVANGVLGAQKGGLALEADEERGELNGEEVKEGVKRVRAVEAAKAGVWGVAFLMGVVGIWGDGVVVRRAVV